MVTYEITAVVDEHRVNAYEEYMRSRHIPDLMATGCFVSASLSQSAPTRFRIRYEAPDRATLDRYLAEHAPRLRDHFAGTFPDGVEVTREEWDVVEAWDGPTESR